MTLIKEINDLRRELKIARTQVHDLEASINVLKKQHLRSNVTVTPNDSQESYLDATEARKMIDLQKQEMRRLRAQIVDLEAKVAERPPSGSRLPPLHQITI